MSFACWVQLVPVRTNTYAEPESEPPSSSHLAPTTAVSPPTATEKPNASFAAASLAVSFACWVQLVPVRTNTYAEPEFVPASSSHKAPTTAVSPLIDAKKPNASPAAASLAVSFACWVQLVPVRTNTYAEPESEPPSSSHLAPTTAVSPPTATEKPNASFAAASLAVSFACWVQLVPVRTNTYAEPEFVPASSSHKAPTTAVSPLTATDQPNSSAPAASLAVSFACWLHVPPLRTNTEAEPEFVPPSSSRKAPTTAVSPLRPRKSRIGRPQPHHWQ